MQSHPNRPTLTPEQELEKLRTKVQQISRRSWNRAKALKQLNRTYFIQGEILSRRNQEVADLRVAITALKAKLDNLMPCVEPKTESRDHAS